MASSNHVTEKPFAPQNQQQVLLKCPRCNSSNTKFCYYNNYSLSQPRHFCKACKRYWTRGGTLRNVPVGGGCRKNKKIKRSTSSTTTTTIGHNPNPNLDHSTSLNNNINPLYGLLQQNPKYERFSTDVSRYDLVHPHMSSLGLGFSSSLASSYPSMFNGGSTSSDPMMASLIASGLEQQPRFMGFTPYGDEGGSLVTDVQIEGIKTGTNWSNNFNCQNDNDHINKSVELSDPTSFLWTTTGGDGGEWLDPTSNICSSVPSLI